MTILKEYRVNNDLVQKEMADKLKCSLPAYRNYENGKRIVPYDILLRFLVLRGYEEDLPVIEALEEFCNNEKEIINN